MACQLGYLDLADLGIPPRIWEGLVSKHLNKHDWEDRVEQNMPCWIESPILYPPGNVDNGESRAVSEQDTSKHPEQESQHDLQTITNLEEENTNLTHQLEKQHEWMIKERVQFASKSQTWQRERESFEAKVTHLRNQYRGAVEEVNSCL